MGYRKNKLSEQDYGPTIAPEDEIPINDRTLKGFIWRENERPNNIKDLFDNY